MSTRGVPNLDDNLKKGKIRTIERLAENKYIQQSI